MNRKLLDFSRSSRAVQRDAPGLQGGRASFASGDSTADRIAVTLRGFLQMPGTNQVPNLAVDSLRKSEIRDINVVVPPSTTTARARGESPLAVHFDSFNDVDAISVLLRPGHAPNLMGNMTRT